MDLQKGFEYVNIVGVELMKYIMKKISPSYLYDKYKDIAHKFCVDNNLQPTKSLWIGLNASLLSRALLGYYHQMEEKF